MRLISIIAIAVLSLTACDFVKASQGNNPQSYLASFPFECGDPSLKISPSVVKVTARTAMGLSQGSGFIVNSERGYILTATHVIADSLRGSIKVTFDNGISMNAAQVASYQSADISLLVTAPTKYPSLALGGIGYGATLESGVPVHAVGWVGDYYKSSPGTIVQALEDNAGWKKVVTTSQVEEGMSGGPLIFCNGRLLGILSSGGKTGGAIAFVISDPTAKGIINFVDGVLAPTPTPTLPPAPTMRPTPVPVVPSRLEAIRLVSQHLQTCQSDRPVLTASLNGGQYLVSTSIEATDESPDFGVWAVYPKTGEVKPIDTISRHLDSEIRNNCVDPNQEALRKRADKFYQAFSSGNWEYVYSYASPNYTKVCTSRLFILQMRDVALELREILGLTVWDSVGLRASNVTTNGNQGIATVDILANGQVVHYGKSGQGSMWALIDGYWWYEPEGWQAGC